MKQVIWSYQDWRRAEARKELRARILMCAVLMGLLAGYLVLARWWLS